MEMLIDIALDWINSYFYLSALVYVQKRRTSKFDLFELVQKFINLQKLLVFALSIINSEIFINQKLQIAK